MSSANRSDAGAPRFVISDFGGVLTTPIHEPFAAYHRESQITPAQLGAAMAKAASGAGTHPLMALEKGLITEESFVAMLEQELGQGALRGFREIYFANLHPNEQMIDYLRSLAGRGFGLALLTNNVREWEPYWRAMIPDADSLFDPVIISAAVGMRKPEREIYELCLQRIGDGTTASDCVFIDDVAQNCEAAATVGMHPVRFADNRQAIDAVERLLAA